MVVVGHEPKRINIPNAYCGFPKSSSRSISYLDTIVIVWTHCTIPQRKATNISSTTTLGELRSRALFHFMCMRDSRFHDLLNLFGSHETMIGVSGPRIILLVEDMIMLLLTLRNISPSKYLLQSALDRVLCADRWFEFHGEPLTTPFRMHILPCPFFSSIHSTQRV